MSFRWIIRWCSASSRHGRARPRGATCLPTTACCPGSIPPPRRTSSPALTRFTADVEIPQGGGEGMIVTHGGRFGGYGLYLLKGKPVFVYNLFDLERFRWEGQKALAAGKHTIAFDFPYDGPGPGKGGTGILKVDGDGSRQPEDSHTIPFLITIDETFDIGRIPARRWTTTTIRCRSTSLARSTGSLQTRTSAVDRERPQDDARQPCKSERLGREQGRRPVRDAYLRWIRSRITR